MMVSIRERNNHGWARVTCKGCTAETKIFSSKSGAAPRALSLESDRDKDC